MLVTLKKNNKGYTEIVKMTPKQQPIKQDNWEKAFAMIFKDTPTRKEITTIVLLVSALIVELYVLEGNW